MLCIASHDAAHDLTKSREQLFVSLLIFDANVEVFSSHYLIKACKLMHCMQFKLLCDPNGPFVQLVSEYFYNGLDVSHVLEDPEAMCGKASLCCTSLTAPLSLLPRAPAGYIMQCTCSPLNGMEEP